MVECTYKVNFVYLDSDGCNLKNEYLLMLILKANYVMLFFYKKQTGIQMISLGISKLFITICSSHLQY
jgi:hypothetical protein